MVTTAILFASGVGIGALGTLIGAGGGWMIVPLLLLGFHFTPQQSVGTSLAVVFLNALSGSIAYMVQGRVLYLMGIVFALATIPGALLGARLAQYLDANAFSALFGLLLLAIAAFLFRGERLMLGVGRKAAADEAALRNIRSPVIRWGALVSFFVGIISSLFGVGGGIIHVPFLILILGIPVHAATATSQFVLAITSLTGTIAFWLLDQVRWFHVGGLGAGVLIGAQGGAFLSTRMRGEPIRRLLAVSLAIFAIRMILRFAF